MSMFEIYRAVLVGGSLTGLVTSGLCVAMIYIRAAKEQGGVGRNLRPWFYLANFDTATLAVLSGYFAARFAYLPGTLEAGALANVLLVVLLIVFSMVIVGLTLTSVIVVLEQGRLLVADRRERAANVRDRAADRRQDTAQTRDESADLRQEEANSREGAADNREGEADERERVADERQGSADSREGAADEREDEADQRDRAADKREIEE